MTVNRWARASVVSIGDVEVFIPFLHQERRTLHHKAFDVPLDVDVTWFVPIRRVEEESEWPVNKNGRHTQV